MVSWGLLGLSWGLLRKTQDLFDREGKERGYFGHSDLSLVSSRLLESHVRTLGRLQEVNNGPSDYSPLGRTPWDAAGSDF